MGKKKIKFSFNPDIEFKLIGMGCRENDYKLSWAINKHLSLQLSKTDSLEIKNPKFSDVQEFIIYNQELDSEETEIKLIANRCENGYLVEELKNVDYFLQILGDPLFDTSEMISQLKEIPEIFAVLDINPDSLKSKQKLIF